MHPQSDAEPTAKRHWSGVLLGLREWATASRARAIGSLMTLVVAVALTVVGWLYMASLAANAGGPDWNEALDAYDRGEMDDAEEIARRLQKNRMDDSDSLGVAMFVLGAVRAHEAEQQWSHERRWLDHRIASKYFLKALEFGVPAEREQQVRRMAARSLIESQRINKAIEVLRQALQDAPSGEVELHRLLAHAYEMQSPPDMAKAIEHSELLLAEISPGDPAYEQIAIEYATKLGRAGRIAEAREQLIELPGESDEKTLAEARFDVAEGRALAKSAELNGDVETKNRADAQLAMAITTLSGFPRTSGSWQLAQLLTAEALALSGRVDDAIDVLTEMRQSHATQQLSTLASLAEADLLRHEGKHEKGLVAYRRALSSLGDPRMYQGDEVSFDELRRRFVSAVEDLQFQQEFKLAHDLTEELTPIIGRTDQLELLAKTLEAWGNHLIAESTRDAQQQEQLANEGRQRLREAGTYYEQLANRRFATPEYIDDLWKSSESYFWGQSYTAAMRVLDDYLRYEPEKRNAQALLRLGQSRLARGEVRSGIAALEECIELYPDDASTYQARLDCAGGFRDLGNIPQAEKLLLANLSGSLQSPRSPEWRDSLFELGHLLHDTGRFTEAIDRLEEAVDRYPKDTKTRLAIYLVADSYRQAADKPLEEFREAQTENERETARKEVNRLLSEAIARYEQVQRDIALSAEASVLDRAMLRNCYMMRADALFDLRRYEEASKAYSNVSTLYQNEPFVLETLVQIANCQRRMNEPLKSRLTIEQALLALDRLPDDADYAGTTNFDREQWRLLLEDMSKWSRE